MTKASRFRWRELPLDRWPSQDHAAWIMATRPAEPLRKGGPASGYAPTAIRMMRSLYGGILHWLAERGELDADVGPADRLTPAIYGAYIAARRATVSLNTVFNNAGMLAMLMKCLAPGPDWRWLKRHPDLPTKEEAMASRRPIREVDLRRVFQGLLERLEPAVLASASLEAALRLRDLLLVAMCTCTALRVSNLRSPSLGRTIHRHGHGFELRYMSGALKNRRQVTLGLAEELTPFLDAYVGSFRPAILHATSVAPEDREMLWLSRNGRRLDNAAVANIFKRVTTEVQGWAANPHSFRHSAATALMRLDLGLLDVGVHLLAHRTGATLAQNYDLSEDQAAQRKWRELYSRYTK